MKSIRLKTGKPKTWLQKLLQRFGLWGIESYRICSSYSDLKILHYCSLKLIEEDQYETEIDRLIAEMAVYTGIPIARLKGLPVPVLIEQILPAVERLKKEIPTTENTAKKNYLNVLNCKYSLPADPFQIETVRWIMIEQRVTSNFDLMKELKSGNFERLPYALAHILEKDAAEKYDNTAKAIEERERVFRHASVEGAVSVLSFFLSLQRRYLKHSLKSSLNLN